MKMHEDDGPKCETCGLTTCPDANLPGFSEPKQCIYKPVYEALRYDRCEYGCGRDITNATVQEAVRALLAATPAPEVADNERDKGLADYLSAMDESGGGIYTADFLDGFRHALAMVAAFESNEPPSNRARPEVREAARLALARRAPGAEARPDGDALIRRERQRQIEVEGYTPEHDAEHGGHLLTQAAYAYEREGYSINGSWPTRWPWRPEDWKPRDPISNLIRAGALYLAADEQGYPGADSDVERCARLIDAARAALAAADAAPESGDL